MSYDDKNNIHQLILTVIAKSEMDLWLRKSIKMIPNQLQYQHHLL